MVNKFQPTLKIIATMAMVILLAGFLISTTYAADISVKPDRSTAVLNESFQLVFTVQGSQSDEPDFSPLNQQFELLSTSTSSQISMINGAVSRSKQYSLTLAAKEAGVLDIPSISFGKDSSPSASITITTERSTLATTTDNAYKEDLFIELETDATSLYVQQQVILHLKIFRLIQWAGASLSEPSFSGVETLIQRIGEEQQYQVTRDGQQYAVNQVDFVLFPQQSGKLTINPFVLTAKILSANKRSGPSGSNRFSDPLFDNFFSRQTYVQMVARSEATTLEIKPIPASFTGKVWLPAKELKLQQSWSTEDSSLQSGEPVTRTVAIIADGLGSGQLPEIQLKEQDGLKIYPDQAVLNDQVSKQGILSTRTQKYALIPSLNGNLDIPDISIAWWNVVTDQQEIAQLDGARFEVTGTTQPVPENTPAETIAGALPAPPTPQMQILPAVENPLSIWLLGSNILLLLLWLITLVAWLKSRQRITSTPTSNSSSQPQSPTSSSRALRHLQATCKKEDNAEAISSALLLWGQAIWADQPPQNINDIAARVTPALGEQISNLNQQLYGAPNTSWRPHKIAEEARQFTKYFPKTSSEVTSQLEPLYR